jgi:acyl-CoA reductase-like NAD-dependent aldehyde dehydrogenase
LEHLDPDLRALQEVRDSVARAYQACERIHGYTQAQIDAVCKSMAEAGARAAADLARLAVEETGIGRAHYKILKNLLGSEGTWASIKDEKTVGIVRRDDKLGDLEVATPVGVVAGIIPTTNPTSTALFKALIALKGKNAIVISPHPRAKRCIGETVEVLRRAIERAGAPADLVISLSNPTIESTGALMRHKQVAVILATGGTGLVQAAYSSGKPAYGVGPGNVPVYVDRSADVALAARTIVQSQSFDNGTLCCSEQALVVDKPIHSALIAEMKRCGAHVCSEEQAKQLAAFCNVRGHMNPDVVGRDPWWIAEKSGFAVPRHTTVLLAYQSGVGPGFPLSIEILAPVLSVHLVEGWQEGCKVSMQTLQHEGLGHTCGVWARDERVLEAWFLEKPANRILVNGPCSEGAVGYSTNLVPSMSLGCGPQAGNITSDNISARHLINVKRVAFVRKDWEELRKRDHARAAKASGEAAPRGSGLPGDPALAASEAKPAQGRGGTEGLHWLGNPTFGAQSGAVQAPPPPPARAPTFTAGAPGSAASSVASAVLSAPAPTAAVIPRPAPPPARQSGPMHAGGGLTTQEIQLILSHAGAGCPMGPCRGCAHHDTNTGACTA